MGDEEIEILDWRDGFLAAHVDENNATLPVPIVNVVDKSTDDDSAVYTRGLGDETKRWTQDLSVTPNTSHKSIETYFCAENTVAYKHKREGYQLFKDGYVKTMRFMPDIQTDGKTCCYLKCVVTASMRGLQYPVDASLSQDTGKVLNAACKCRSSGGGVCKHVAAALFQLVDYKLDGLRSVPEDKACTDLLQQWNIRGEGKNADAVEFENLRFEKANQERDTKKSRKRPILCGKRDFCATPVFARDGPSPKKLELLHDELKESNQGNYLCSLLAGNNFQKCTTFSTSVSELAASVSDELDIASRNHDNDRLISMYDNFACEYDKQLVTEEKDIEFVRNHLPIEKGVLKDIEKGSKLQSESQSWFAERRKRITASNFGLIMNRIKIKHPTSILKQLLEHKIFKSKACDWGKVNEKAAVTLYESSNNVKVTTCGLVINPRWPWLGCSPDGLLDDRTIEIKCPYK